MSESAMKILSDGEHVADLGQEDVAIILRGGENAGMEMMIPAAEDGDVMAGPNAMLATAFCSRVTQDEEFVKELMTWLMAQMQGVEE